MASARSLDETLVKARAFHQSGQASQAIGLYEEVLRHAPEHAVALYWLGIAHYQLGNLPHSASLLQRAISLRPGMAGANYNLGTILHALQRYEEAIPHYKQAIAVKPDDIEAYNNLAVALKALNRHDEAIGYYRKALGLNPQYAEAYVNLANVLQAVGRDEEAISNYRQALALNPDLIEATTSCARLLQAADRHEEALPLYQKALALRPDDVDAYIGLGNALFRLQRRNEAVQHYEQALVLRPSHAELQLALGKALNALNRHEEATQCFENTIALDPDNAEAHVLLGNMLVMLDRCDDASQYYEKALELRPYLSAAKLRKGTLYLSMGRLAEGWELYDSRWDGVFNESSLPRYFHPRWDGDHVKGSLLIWGEQGIGDYILFSSMVPDLIGCADSILLEVEPRLVKLLARSFPQVQVIEKGQDIYAGPVDAHESLAGLGKFFRPDWTSFPRREAGYLLPDSGLVAELRARLTTDDRIVVGLSWRSVKPWMHEAITAPLRSFESLLQLPGCRFIDLQYGDTLIERDTLARDLGIHVERLTDVDNTNDIDALAALISACDVVVTISNTTAHLAGAVGKPTWVIVPYSKALVWHWFKGRRESPWYPRVRVLHQKRGQPWSDLMQLVADEIRTFAGKALHGQ